MIRQSRESCSPTSRATAALRHAFDESQDQCLEEKREPASRPGPWYCHQFHAAGLARHPWNTGVEECLMLEEVQVLPRLLRAVVGPTASLAPLGAGETSPLLEV